MVGPRLRDVVTARASPAAVVSVSPYFPPAYSPPAYAMGRHIHSMLVLSLLTFIAARAHEHDEELTEEVAHAAVDSILWIHIFLQAAVWGILFPIGMVFGMSRSRWHVPVQVRSLLPPSFPLFSLDLSLSYYPLTDSLLRFHPPSALIVGCRDCAHARRLHTRAQARRPRISSERAWQVCQYPPHANCGAAGAGSLPQAAHPRADTASVGCARTRCHRKVISGAGMGPDALWCNRVPRVLSWWCPWAVSCTLYHGA